MVRNILDQGTFQTTKYSIIIGLAICGDDTTDRHSKTHVKLKSFRSRRVLTIVSGVKRHLYRFLEDLSR